MITDRLSDGRSPPREGLDEAAKKLAELQKADELGFEAGTRRIAADKAAAKIEADRSPRSAREGEGDRGGVRRRSVAHRRRAALRRRSSRPRPLPTSLKHASPAFLADVELDTDETHKITGVRLGGVAHKTLADAATEWLKHNSHFAQVRGRHHGHRVRGGRAARATRTAR